MADPAFTGEFERMLREYAGVPSLLYDATRLSELAGARILLKREDLNHTGAHKIRNVLGQALLTKRMGKTRVIAETGAGQHGVASATAAAYLGLDCVVYMGEVDTERQALNVARMQLLGAEVVPVTSRLAHAQGRHQRGDARLGRQRRPHGLPLRHGRRPAPVPVDGPRLLPRHRRRGARAVPRADRRAARRRRRLRRRRLQRDRAVHRLRRRRRRCGIVGFEAGGDGVDTGRHAATIYAGEVGVLHGARTFVLQDEDGQTIESHSISAGLDYPGVGPEHAYLAETGRATYRPVTDAEAMDAFVAAGPHRGDHPGDRVRARGRRRDAAGEGAAGRDDPGATSPAAATRTWAPRSSGSAWGSRHGRGPADERPRSRAMSAVPAAFAAAAGGGARPRSSATCPPGSPPSRARSRRCAAMVDAGCDVIEVGLPYSDPVMDGPTIQAAAQQALEARRPHHRRAPRRRGGRGDRRRRPW